MQMRLRLPELLEERETTAYAVAKRSGGRIIPATLYRLVRSEGRVELFSADLCEALCDVLKIKPSELFELEGAAAGPAAVARKRPTRKSAGAARR